MMNHLLITALVAALSPHLEPRQDQPTPEVILEIQNPKPGATLSNGLSVSFALTGNPEREFEVEVSCFGTTHHHLAAGDSPWRRVDEQGRATWSFRDVWILPEAGPATLTVRVHDLGGIGIGGERRLIEEREVDFRYEPLSGKALTGELAEQTDSIIYRWMSLCDEIEPRKEPFDFDRNNPEHLMGVAKGYVASRHDWLRARLTAYSILSDTYEFALKPGDALRALRYAKELWDAESGEVVSRPPLPPTPILWRLDHWTYSPMHLDKLASFYARRNDLDRAQHFAEQEIAYYKDQVQRHSKLDAWHRDRCNEHAAWRMADVAKWHYLLRRDREGYDRWMAQYQATKPKAAGNRGLLGQE